MSLLDFLAIWILFLMLSLPGWALWTLFPGWRCESRLQSWCLALGLGIAFYPVLFYYARVFLPGQHIGPFKIGCLLLVCCGFLYIRIRKDFRYVFGFSRSEWLAIGLMGMTLFTRFWVIREQSFPAWSDSLHHTLLTQLTAAKGWLPWNLEPYVPISMEHYHLGLYAISGTFQRLASIPAHTAIHWTTQFLNALCGLGVFLLLDRKVGRIAALVGTASVGLVFHQPAFYVNWGRSTQIAAQSILLIAWIITWEFLVVWIKGDRDPKYRYSLGGLAVLLNAGLFLLHFRVAVYYLPLLAITVVVELYRAYRTDNWQRWLTGCLILMGLTLLLIAPALIPLSKAYLQQQSFTQEPVSAAVSLEIRRSYYEFPWESVPILFASWWLIGITAVAAVYGLFRRNAIAWQCVLWAIILYAIGKLYLLGVPFLAFTNLSGLLIAFYLPAGIVLGVAAQESVAQFAKTKWNLGQTWILLLAGSAFIGSHLRVIEIDVSRFFVTSADVAAMGWVRENTPAQAVFAVNTWFWLPHDPHGTDAGYWMPYLADRKTTTGVMLNSLGSPVFRHQILQYSQALEQVKTSDSALPGLKNLGVDYIYIGARRIPLGVPLDPVILDRYPGLQTVYRKDGVVIYKIL